MYNTYLQLIQWCVCVYACGFYFFLHMVVISGPGGKNEFPWSHHNLQKLLFYHHIKKQTNHFFDAQALSAILPFLPHHCYHFLTFWSFSPHLCKSLASSLQPPSPKLCHHFRCFQIQENNFPKSTLLGHLQ